MTTKDGQIKVEIGPSLAKKKSKKKQFLDFMGIFLKTADTGVDGIITEKIEFNLDKLFAEMPEALKAKLANIKVNERVLFSTPDGRRFALLREESGELSLLKLKARHQLAGTEEHIDFEIDRSMHPLLSRMFLQAYLDDTNCGRATDYHHP